MLAISLNIGYFSKSEGPRKEISEVEVVLKAPCPPRHLQPKVSQRRTLKGEGLSLSHREWQLNLPSRFESQGQEGAT